MNIITSEKKKALKGMSKGKAGCAAGLSIDLSKDAGDFLLDKLAVYFSKCLQNCTVSSDTVHEEFLLFAGFMLASSRNFSSWMFPQHSTVYKQWTKEDRSQL